MLYVRDAGQRNFRLPPALERDFDTFLKSLNTHGVDLKPSFLAAGAILGFLELKLKDQITLIKRAKSYDLEKLKGGIPQPAVTEADIDELLTDIRDLQTSNARRLRESAAGAAQVAKAAHAQSQSEAPKHKRAKAVEG